MVDGDGKADKRDRVLVRPYVKDDPSEPERTPPPDPRASAETQIIPQIEQPPDPPADGAGPTGADPVDPTDLTDPAGEDRGRRGLLLLVGGALALIVAIVAVVVAIWPHDHDSSDGLPATSPVWPLGSAGPSAQQPSAGVSASASKATASPSASTSVSPSASSASASASPTASSAPSRTASSTATATAPATDLTGAITGAGGHCLDARGQIALLGSNLSVYNCNNTLSQKWTLATDGTLRVAGMCAAATGTTSVHVATCDTDDVSLWSRGSGGTLISKSTSNCLTDPDAGAKTGNSLRLTTCGTTGQSWSLH